MCEHLVVCNHQSLLAKISLKNWTWFQKIVMVVDHVLCFRLNGDQLKPLEAEIQPTQENKDEIMKACDINVQYPSGNEIKR